MTSDYNGVMIGFDLCPDFSQITFYHQKYNEPITVSAVPGEEKYQMPTPRDLFSLVEQKVELGTALLSNFFKLSLEKLTFNGSRKQIKITVTMAKMNRLWVDAITRALGMLDIEREAICLQDHRESFYYYALNQKRDLWHFPVALFEYEKDRIIAYRLRINYKTKPALAEVEKQSTLYLDNKARQGMAAEEWQLAKDQLFLKQMKEFMEEDRFSAVYLIGEHFDKEWAELSLDFLCKKCHVFQGKNLYTKGACYCAMEWAGVLSLGQKFLYNSPDMIRHNLGMQMRIRGRDGYHNMIRAGINYYMADYECEFLLDDTVEVVLFSQGLGGEEVTHTIELGDLPQRPNKATRIRMKLMFTSGTRCKVILDDLGMGELYPSSGKKWQALIDLAEQQT